MILEDRFYSAPEVAQILGVTLRSLYRYIRDGKIETFKTAGGRLRFTKEAITNFLGPQIRKERVQPATPAKPEYLEERYFEEVEEVAPKVRRAPNRGVVPTPTTSTRQPGPSSSRPSPAAASRRSNQWYADKVPTKPSMATSLYNEEPLEEEEPVVIPEPEKIAPSKHYFRSNIRDLRLLAQKIQKSCTNAHVPYAFTGQAGMSLHQEMPPFSVIHVYIRLDDLPFFENVLQAQEVSNEDEANLGFLAVTDLDFWKSVETFKGFKVVNQAKLEEDLGEI